MRLGHHGFARIPDLAAALRFDMALEADDIGAFGPGKLPRVVLRQPVLRRLDLPPAFEALAEQAMLIADAIAIGRAAQRRHRFHEAGRQPAKPAVPQCRVRLIPDHGAQVLAHRRHRLVRLVVKTQVDRRVLKDAADQKLHRQVVDPLPVFGPGPPGRGEPRLDNPVADRVAQGHAPVMHAGMRRVLADGEGQVAQDIGLQKIGGHAQIGHFSVQHGTTFAKPKRRATAVKRREGPEAPGKRPGKAVKPLSCYRKQRPFPKVFSNFLPYGCVFQSALGSRLRLNPCSQRKSCPAGQPAQKHCLKATARQVDP